MVIPVHAEWGDYCEEVRSKLDEKVDGFNAGAVPGGDQQPARRVKPDEIVAGEAGARFTLFEGRLRGRSAVFVADWRNIQSDRFDGRGLPFTANLGATPRVTVKSSLGGTATAAASLK